MGSRTRTVLGDDLANSRRLHTVDDIIAGTGDEVPIAKNLYIALNRQEVLSTDWPAAEMRLARPYVSRELLD